jgi:hypothetical protein
MQRKERREIQGQKPSCALRNFCAFRGFLSFTILNISLQCGLVFKAVKKLKINIVV